MNQVLGLNPILCVMISWHYGPMWTDEGAWMAYICIELGTDGLPGLTDCEWLVLGTAKP
jgi:hypothetical protein